MEYDQTSTLFWWLLFVPCFLGLPVAYFTYVIFDIWKRGLLPPMGRRRNLSLYFFRLVFVYFFMWFPFALICTVGNFVNISSWIFWAGAAWSHLQGLASALVSLTKPDIKEAVVSFLCCIRLPDEGAADDFGSSENRRGSSIQTSIMKSLRFASRDLAMPVEGAATGAVAAKMTKHSSTFEASKEQHDGSDGVEDDGSDVAGYFVSG
jgi:hypothetical protein